MLKVGVWLPSDLEDPGEYLADARALEAADADSLWVGSIRSTDGPHSLGLEGMVLLAAIAAVTTQVRLGVFLSPAPGLTPELLAGMLDPLQRVSRGRTMLALGAPEELDRLRPRRNAEEGPPFLLVSSSDSGHRIAVRSAHGVICPTDPAGMQAIFTRVREFLGDDPRPFELWAQCAAPADLNAWRELRTACATAGATGLIVPFSPRLLDMLRRGDDVQEDDRSDLLQSYG